MLSTDEAPPTSEVRPKRCARHGSAHYVVADQALSTGPLHAPGFDHFEIALGKYVGAALKSRLATNVLVRPDSVRATLTAVALVPGDTVKMSSGAVVAAAVRLMKGGILPDQSMLAGESILIEAGPGFQTFAGGLVRRGEAVAEVTAAGARTKFEPAGLRTLGVCLGRIRQPGGVLRSPRTSAHVELEFAPLIWVLPQFPCRFGCSKWPKQEP